MDGLAERDPPRGPAHGSAFDPIERRGVTLRDVLERGVNQGSRSRRPPRNLSAGEDERFFPGVDAVPAITQEGAELAAIEEGVDATCEMSGDGDDALVALGGFEGDGAEVAVAFEVLRRYGGGGPAGAARAGPPPSPPAGGAGGGGEGQRHG